MKNSNNQNEKRDSKESTEASEIAKFYGFKPVEAPHLTKTDFDLTKNFDESHFPAEKAALLRSYFDEKMIAMPQPVMFYCERPFPGSKSRMKPGRLECTLASLGSSKSVCECLSIQAAVEILNKVGFKNLEIQVNSIGDKESNSEFQRKLNLFIKKNYNSLPASMRQLIKKDPIAILKDKKEECKNLQAECPKPLDFLSEPSRLHFKEVLEFLEIMEIPYSINQTLLGDPSLGSETVFSIFDTENGEELASGFRFNKMAKKIGMKKDLPSVLLNISVKLKKKLKKTRAKNISPKFYLIQFGPEAKLKSFLVLRELYRAGVRVNHLVAKDKLISQMGMAENSGVPYIILIGQKEALENSVVIRNNANRAQDLVLISELASKIKELD